MACHPDNNMALVAESEYCGGGGCSGQPISQTAHNVNNACSFLYGTGRGHKISGIEHLRLAELLRYVDQFKYRAASHPSPSNFSTTIFRNTL